MALQCLRITREHNHDPEVIARGVEIEVSDLLWGQPGGPPGAGMAAPRAIPAQERLEVPCPPVRSATFQL